MTIYYVDPESGNDANDGLSFATRWKTLKGLRLTTYAAGDEIRFKASKPSYSLGGAQWVDNQAYFTLDDPSGFVMVDNCESGWSVVSPNLLDYLNPATGKDSFMDAGVMLRIVPANFTGKLAYKTLPAPLDLSGFTHISMLMNNGQNWPFGMALTLCSDTVGNVPIVTLAIEQFRSYKFPALLTNGGAALPSGVQSIALHVTEARPDTFNIVILDNIIACKAPTDPKHVSHSILVSRMTETEPEWMPVRGFKAPGRVYIGGCRGADDPIAWPNWRGPAGSSEAFAMQPTKLRFWRRYENDVAPGSNEYDFTGGWSRTDMSVQDGVTWLHGEHSRMLNGGQGSANPDLPSAADRQQQIFNPVNDVGNVYVWKRWTFKNFGLAEFYNSPFNYESQYFLSQDIQLEGMAGVRRGFGPHGPYSHFDLGNVAFCTSGPFYEFQVPTQPLAPTILAGIQHFGPSEYVANRVVGSDRVWLPPQGFGVENVYAVKEIQNCNYGLDTTTQSAYREFGYGKISGTSFRWCQYGDVIASTNVHMENCKFLDSDTGLPTRNPFIAWGYRRLAQVRLDSVNGKSWDTRTYVQGGQSARVMEGQGRAPNKRALVLEPAIEQNVGTRLQPFMRERIALVVARAGVPTVVSAYLKQAASIEGAPFILPQFVRIATVAGLVKGVGRHMATGIQRKNVWGRVVLEFTAEEDALVPIYLETDTYTAWGTECGLDDSGLPPDPYFPKPPPVKTDSFTFVAFYENIMGVLDSYEAGTQEAEDAMAAGIGVPFPGMTDGTILDMSLGNIIGVALIPQEGTVQAYGVFKPGYQNDGGFQNCYIVLKNGAGDIIAQPEPNFANVTAIPSMPGYAYFAFLGGVSSEPLAAGNTYTLEVWRGEPD